MLLPAECVDDHIHNSVQRGGVNQFGEFLSMDDCSRDHGGADNSTVHAPQCGEAVQGESKTHDN